MNDVPELNAARRVTEKYKLKPPVDVENIAEHYADLKIVPFPANLDGVCFNLKVPGKRPAIILNSKKSPKRQRFTLAHEIGHVLIPWHFGTIVDEIDLIGDNNNFSYWELEREANNFAAELLMPRSWVKSLTKAYDDPGQALKEIIDVADVSINAALIQLINSLEAGYLYALIDEAGFVRSSDRSLGTLAGRLPQGVRLDEVHQLVGSDFEWRTPLHGGVCVWWHFPHRRPLPKTRDKREWRQLLDIIVEESATEELNVDRLKSSVNGIFGYSNSITKHDNSVKSLRGRREALFTACMQRFSTRAIHDRGVERVLKHHDFPNFISARIKDLLKQ